MQTVSETQRKYQILRKIRVYNVGSKLQMVQTGLELLQNHILHMVQIAQSPKIFWTVCNLDFMQNIISHKVQKYFWTQCNLDVKQTFKYCVGSKCKIPGKIL